MINFGQTLDHIIKLLVIVMITCVALDAFDIVEFNIYCPKCATLFPKLIEHGFAATDLPTPAVSLKAQPFIVVDLYVLGS